ncbi:MAG: WecB/TagA/CpsF family glycosyltransferase [Chloroflexi bacterium]|nr:WecB/TagA/CpsF family glycosyltransferase [Chloroflexota bacterium]
MAIGVREGREALEAVAEPIVRYAPQVPLVTAGALRPRLDLCGVLVDRIDRAGALDRIAEFLESGRPHQIVTVNLDFLYLAERNAEFRETLNAADLAVADGMPIVWTSHLSGTPLPGRVTGVELVDASCRLAAQKGAGVFLLGGAPDVSEIAVVQARERYPGLQVSGYAPPIGPIGPDEDDRIVEMILRASPGFLFVALGAPRQDLWIRAHRERLGVPVAMGVGCVVDLLAGAVQRAPAWMQSTGLEWSFRLFQEPGRLWRRYLVDDLPMFLRLTLLALDGPRWRVGAANDIAAGGLTTPTGGAAARGVAAQSDGGLPQTTDGATGRGLRGRLR